MRCPHCRRDIAPPDRSYRECGTCGGAHRIMDVCPEKPDFFQLMRMWLSGDRPLEGYLAMGGTCLFVFLIVLALMLVAHG